MDQSSVKDKTIDTLNRNIQSLKSIVEDKNKTITFWVNKSNEYEMKYYAKCDELFDKDKEIMALNNYINDIKLLKNIIEDKNKTIEDLYNRNEAKTSMSYKEKYEKLLIDFSTIQVAVSIIDNKISDNKTLIRDTHNKINTILQQNRA